MRFAFVLPVVAAAVTLAPLRDAAACGGSFPPPSQTIDVASHRMVLSVSQSQTTLYDQVAYTGDPSSFAWVLPIKGTATVGVSSDALFEILDQITTVTISGPNVSCPVCDSQSSADSTGTTGGTGGGGGGVMVIAQQAVGPYATVQLASSDPTALSDWLSTNGFQIPSGAQPVITDYINGGFNFLAVKLQPGMGVQAMVPISVTTTGASAVLPLRMVSVGAPATTPITLWVLGEGRYAPTNFPTFTVDASDLVWDFNTSTSNYTTLMNQGFASSKGLGWLIEAAYPMAETQIQGPLDDLVQSDPMDSGYGDGSASGAATAETADLMTLFNGIDPTSFYVTRMLAQLPVAALVNDMTLGAATSQQTVSSNLIAGKSKNAPTCQSCGTGGSFATSVAASSGAGGAPGSNTTTSGAGGAGGGASSSSGCSVGQSGDASLATYGLLAALAMIARRRLRS